MRRGGRATTPQPHLSDPSGGQSGSYPALDAMGVMVRVLVACQSAAVRGPRVIRVPRDSKMADLSDALFDDGLRSRNAMRCWVNKHPG
jgi:hypothetical protein